MKMCLLQNMIFHVLPFSCTHLVQTVMTTALLLCCGWQYLVMFNRGQIDSL